MNVLRTLIAWFAARYTRRCRHCGGVFLVRDGYPELVGNQRWYCSLGCRAAAWWAFERVANVELP